MKLYMDACHFGNILPLADERNKHWHGKFTCTLAIFYAYRGPFTFIISYSSL